MNQIVKTTGRIIVSAMFVSLLIGGFYMMFTQESQADVLVRIEQKRASMEALNLKIAEIDAEKAELGKKMDAEKMKLTAETCKEQKDLGKPQNCPQVF
jgi:septal ring factor EnvC (AmiA/AmiB activator)